MFKSKKWDLVFCVAFAVFSAQELVRLFIGNGDFHKLTLMCLLSLMNYQIYELRDGKK